MTRFNSGRHAWTTLFVLGGVVLLACSNESGVCDPDRPKTCPSPSTSTSSSSGGSSSGSTCSDKGFCSPNDDHCECGLSCIHVATGSYTCGDSCVDDSDCKDKKDPQSGKAYGHCAQGTLQLTAHELEA